MKIEEVFSEKNYKNVLEKEKTWSLPDGSYAGKISDFKPIKDKKYIFIEIEVDGQTKRMSKKTETKHFTQRERSGKIKKKSKGAEKWKNLLNGWNAWKTQDSRAK